MLAKAFSTHSEFTHETAWVPTHSATITFTYRTLFLFIS